MFDLCELHLPASLVRIHYPTIRQRSPFLGGIKVVVIATLSMK